MFHQSFKVSLLVKKWLYRQENHDPLTRSAIAPLVIIRGRHFMDQLIQSVLLGSKAICWNMPHLPLPEVVSPGGSTMDLIVFLYEMHPKSKLSIVSRRECGRGLTANICLRTKGGLHVWRPPLRGSEKRQMQTELYWFGHPHFMIFYTNNPKMLRTLYMEAHSPILFSSRHAPPRLPFKIFIQRYA